MNTRYQCCPLCEKLAPFRWVGLTLKYFSCPECSDFAISVDAETMLRQHSSRRELLHALAKRPPDDHVLTVLVANARCSATGAIGYFERKSAYGSAPMP